jgi:hypothetical protein
MSHPIRSRLTLAVLASLVIAVLAAPHASVAAGPRSPDAHDAWLAAMAQTTPGKDLRSPDARDAARGVYPAPAPSTGSSGSSDWAYLAVGGGLAFVLVAGATFTIARRRHRAAHPVAAITR